MHSLHTPGYEYTVKEKCRLPLFRPSTWCCHIPVAAAWQSIQRRWNRRGNNAASAYAPYKFEAIFAFSFAMRMRSASTDESPDSLDMQYRTTDEIFMWRNFHLIRKKLGLVYVQGKQHKDGQQHSP